jgi:hypothetical protein
MGTASSAPSSVLHQEVTDVTDTSDDEKREEEENTADDGCIEEKELTRAEQKIIEKQKRQEFLASKQRKRGGTFVLHVNKEDSTKKIRFDLHVESASALQENTFKSSFRRPREKKEDVLVAAPVVIASKSSGDDENLREDEGVASILVQSKKKEKKSKSYAAAAAANLSSGSTVVSTTSASLSSRCVSWGQIEVREFKRTVGRGVVADHSDQTWLLGLSDIILFNGVEHSPTVPPGIEEGQSFSDDAEALEYEKHLAELASSAAAAAASSKEKKSKLRTASVAEPLTKLTSTAIPEITLHAEVSESTTSSSASVSASLHNTRQRLIARRVTIPGLSQRLGSVDEVETKRLKNLAERYSKLSVAQKALILTPTAQAALSATGGDFSRAAATNLSVALETRQSHNKTLRAAARIAASAASTASSSSSSSLTSAANDHKRNPFWDYLKQEERRLIFERDVGTGVTATNGELFSLGSLSEHFASIAQAKRDAKGCDCNAKIDKEVKRHSSSLKDLQSLATKLGMESFEETKELTKKELGEKIAAHLKHDRLCLNPSPPTFDLTETSTESSKLLIHAEGMDGDELDLKRLIESHDFAQAPPEAPSSANHVLMNARAGFIRARLLEEEVDKDMRSFFVQRQSHGIENFGSVTSMVSSSPLQSSPMSTPHLTSQTSVSMSTSSPALAASFDCPCALDGVGCHYARCNCSVGECNNLSFWHCTSARYDAEATEVFRSELIGYSKNRQLKLFLDAETDMVAVWNSIDAHWAKEKEKAVKRGGKKAARAERRNEKEDEERQKREQKEREEQDRVEAEAAAAIVERYEREEEERIILEKRKALEARLEKEIQDRIAAEEEARRKEAEEKDRVKKESLEALQRDMIKHQQRIAQQKSKARGERPIGVESVSLETLSLDEKALVTQTQPVSPPKSQPMRQKQQNKKLESPFIIPTLPSPFTAASSQKSDSEVDVISSSPSRSPMTSSRQRGGSTISPRGGGPVADTKVEQKQLTPTTVSPRKVGLQKEKQKSSPISASVAAALLREKLASEVTV